MKRRICWTVGERQLVINEMARLMRLQGACEPGLGCLVLPEERQRSWFSDKEQREMREAAREIAFDSKIAQQLQKASEVEQGIRLPEFHISPPHVRLVIELGPDTREFIRKLFMKDDEQPSLQPHNPFPKQTIIDQPKPKILVVGLKNDQVEEVKKVLLNEPILLAFHSKDATDHALKLEARFADRMILMTKFISHATQQVAQATGVPIEFHSGGISGLIQRLKEKLNG